MATKPTDTPRWATSASRTVQPPENGALTTSKDAGFLNATRPPARFLNWILNNIYTWVLWLQDINNQTFTSGGVGAWTKPHQFTTSVANTTAGSFQGNGTGAGVSATGGGSNGTGMTCSGGGNGYAVLGTGNGSNPAGAFVGAADGAGVYGEGGPDIASPGGDFLGGSGGIGGHGVRSLGFGQGAGILATGGATGAGVKAHGGASGGAGVIGTGGSGSIGVQGIGGASGGAGVDAVGTSGAPGITALGNGAGAGIEATGGATAGPGVRAVGGANGFALEVSTGNATFTGTPPTSSANPGQHALSSANVCKAWVSISCPSGVPAILDGYNIASVAMSGVSSVDVNLTRAFPGVYCPIVSIAGLITGANMVPMYSVATISSTKLRITFYADPNTLKDITTISLEIYVQVMGRQ